jgi:hypothetical protein
MCLLYRARDQSDEQPHDKPDALSLSAIISQYFIGSLRLSSPDEFPKPRIPADDFFSLIDLLERGRGRKAHGYE